MKCSFDTTDVLGYPYAELNYTQASSMIAGWGASFASKTVVVAPVSSVIMAKRSAELHDAFVDADLIASDGVPIVWARKLMGRKDASRLYGPDLMLHTLAACEREGVAVGFVGGRPERLAGLEREVEDRFPRLDVGFSWSPPFRTLGDDEVARLGADLNSAGVGVVFVGIGCPKQEMLMARLKPHVRAVQVGVGAAFDFIPGYVRQAPGWMQRNGLEWAFRIACEPRRLWKRYATTIPPFVVGAGAQVVGHHMSRVFGVRRSVS